MKTEQEWQSIFERWKTSPLSQHDFCKAEGVTYGLFSKKRAILNRKMNQPTQSSLSPLQFLPIDAPRNLVPKPLRPKMIEIQLPHGILLRIPADAAA
jgi:hypothetical protein